MILSDGVVPPAPAPLLVLCSWCDTTISDGVLINGRASHGMCARCVTGVRGDIRWKKASNTLDSYLAWAKTAGWRRTGQQAEWLASALEH